MKWKVDEDGNVVLEDGKPVLIHDDGSEAAFDVESTLGTIKRLNGEAKGHREAKEEAERKLQNFEGIDDPAAAKKALDTLKNLDDKKLVDAGEVEKLKSDLNKGWEEKLQAEREAREAAEQGLHGEKLTNRFANSKFIKDSLIVPPDVAKAVFGNRFQVKDGKIVALGEDGQPLPSKANPGEPADFDEGLKMMVERYPHRDSIMKADQLPGGGAQPGQGEGGKGGKRVVTREQFDQMDAAERSAHVKEGGTVADK